MQKNFKYSPEDQSIPLPDIDFENQTVAKFQSLATSRAGVSKPSDIADNEVWQKVDGEGNLIGFYRWTTADGSNDGTLMFAGVATTEEAQAGINATKSMTPDKVKEMSSFWASPSDDFIDVSGQVVITSTSPDYEGALFVAPANGFFFHILTGNIQYHIIQLEGSDTPSMGGAFNTIDSRLMIATRKGQRLRIFATNSTLVLQVSRFLYSQGEF